jgi:transposase
VTSAPALPQDLPAAHVLITRLHFQLDDSQTELRKAYWQIQQLKKQLFGPTADRAPLAENLSKEQVLLSLFPPPAEPPAAQEVLLPDSPTAKIQLPARRPRQPQLGSLETVTERIEPAETICPHCGQAKCEIGCEKSERFEYVPAKIIRHEILRPKLACPCGQGTVVIAPLPPAPIEKGMPGPGLLAQVILSKYADHLPLYRQQQQFERLGVYFPRQTLSEWVEKGADLLRPIVGVMKRDLQAGDYLQVDETPVRVMDPEVKGRCATGYLWVAGRPGGDVLFEFHPGRGKQYAEQLLGDFQGYLQRDGYGVYGALAAQRPEQIVPVGCLSHARRKFVDALIDEPKEAEWFVGEIRKIYLIEAHAREQAMSPVQRFELRLRLARPILVGLKSRLEQLADGLLPQSPLGKAVRYALNEWNPIQNFLSNGRLEADNNLTENALRPSCLGKKNWLFLGHPEAGWRSAVIYSIIASCRRRGIDPWEYLKDVFTRLPGATNQQIAEFVPARWKSSVKDPGA